MNGFAERLRKTRIRQGLSQADLELEAKLTEGYVSKLERGVRTSVYLHTGIAIADALKVDVRWLATGE